MIKGLGIYLFLWIQLFILDQWSCPAGTNEIQGSLT